MSSRRVYLGVTILALAMVVSQTQGSSSIVKFENKVCRLLNDKFTASHPTSAYPIVYEPIKRGQLTIWSGMSNLPTSEFRCSSSDRESNNKNTTKDIILDFAGFSNKLELTFFDATRGATYHGASISYHEDVKYRVTIENKQADSYLECNSINSVVKLSNEIDNGAKQNTHTICRGCSQILIAMIDSQIKDLMKSKFEDQILDNLYWQLTQLITNQHFHGPMPLNNNFD